MAGPKIRKIAAGGGGLMVTLALSALALRLGIWANTHAKELDGAFIAFLVFAAALGAFWMFTKDDAEVGTADPILADSDDRVPIWQAVEHVAILSTHESNGDYLPKSREVIRQFAADGKLKIWGKRHLGVRSNFDSRFDTVWAPLPPEFWVDNRILADASTEMKNPNVPFTIPIQGDGTWNGSYADLLVSKREVESLWPERD